jgi:hypothetical protein
MALGLIDLDHFRVLDSRRSRSIFHSQRSLSINLTTCSPFEPKQSAQPASCRTLTLSSQRTLKMPTTNQPNFQRSVLCPRQRFGCRELINLRLPLLVVNRNFRFVSDSFFASDCRGQCLRERESSRFSPTPQVPFRDSAKVF